MASATYPKDFILYDVSHDEVYLTGSFTDWRPNAIKMTKIPNLYFIATVQLPYGTKVSYKYIVNGVWMTNPEEETETDAAGNTNNVFTTPSESHAPAPVAPVPTATSTSTPYSTSSASSAGGPSGAAGEIQEAKSSGVPVGGAAASAGIAAAAAGTAVAAGLGHDSSDKDAGGKQEILEAKTSGVPTGAAVASSGIAEAAAESAASHGLGQTETGQTETAQNETEGVTGIQKIAPNVTQASSTGGAVSEKDLAKSDVGSGSSSTSASKAPLPASTADAPLAPGQTVHEHEGKGLFAVIGGLGAAAASAAVQAAHVIEHKIEEKFYDVNGSPALSTTAKPDATLSGLSSEGSKTATQTPAVPTSASTPTIPSNAQINREIAAHPDPTAGAVATTATAGNVGNASLIGSSHKEPAEALNPIATNNGVNKITKELAAVDFDHTKAEVVHAVERLGEVIAGGLTGIGAAHQGRDAPPVSEFWAKKGSSSATSAFGKPLHDAENSLEKSGSQQGSSTGGASALSTSAFGAGGSGLSNAVAAIGGASSTTSAATASAPGHASAISGSALNTADKTLNKDSSSAPTLPPVSGGPALYPTDGKTAPAQIKIDEPQSHPSQVRSEAHEAGHTAPALTGDVAGASTAAGTTGTTAGTDSTSGQTATGDKRKSSFLQRVKSEIKGDKGAEKSTSSAAATDSAAPSSTSNHVAAREGLVGAPELAAKETGVTPTTGSTTTPTGTASKATGASALGVNNAGGSSSLPPTTPKKTSAATAAGANGTPGTPADGYKTATSTPSDTPDRQRKKSGFFGKLKSALSPSK